MRTKVKKERREKLTPLTIFMLVFLVVYCLAMGVLFLFAVMMAFQDPLMYMYPTVLPYDKIYFGNFSAVLSVQLKVNSGGTLVYSTMGDIIFNSVVYALGCGLINTAVTGVTAYLCATYKYKYSKVVHTTVIVVMTIPIVGSQAAELGLLNALNLYDTWFGLLILKANFLGMYFLIFYEMFSSLPITYREAATLDGADDWRVMLNVYFPLARATFGTVLLINFINFWNDYQTPMLYAPSRPTLSRYLIEIAIMSTANDFDSMPIRMTTSIILSVPTLTLFLIFQKKLMSNLTIGGIKG